MKYLIPLLLVPAAAVAQQNSPCDNKEKVNDLLTQQYGERPFIEMKDVYDRQMIMYVNPNTGTWTVIVTKDDVACGVSSGKDFSPADPNRFKAEPKKDPS